MKEHKKNGKRNLIINFLLDNKKKSKTFVGIISLKKRSNNLRGQ